MKDTLATAIAKHTRRVGPPIDDWTLEAPLDRMPAPVRDDVLLGRLGETDPVRLVVHGEPRLYLLTGIVWHHDRGCVCVRYVRAVHLEFPRGSAGEWLAAHPPRDIGTMPLPRAWREPRAVEETRRCPTCGRP